jgi:hypothetical protein
MRVIGFVRDREGAGKEGDAVFLSRTVAPRQQWMSRLKKDALRAVEANTFGANQKERGAGIMRRIRWSGPGYLSVHPEC